MVVSPEVASGPTQMGALSLAREYVCPTAVSMTVILPFSVEPLSDGAELLPQPAKGTAHAMPAVTATTANAENIFFKFLFFIILHPPPLMHRNQPYR